MILEINNISITFHRGTPNEVRALQGVDLSVEEGSFVCVLGTNGSGKSTLLNMVAGCHFPDKGEILLDGIDISSFPEYKRASWIGRVFQNPFSGTAPDMTIAENLALAARRGLKRGLSFSINSDFLQLVIQKLADLHMGLEDRLNTPIGKLSGGQRQVLTLLMATWNKPRLLLLDEHTAALDPRTAAKVIQLSKNIIEKERLTTLMVTHSMQQAADLGDRLIMMDEGRIVYDFSGPEKKRLRPADLYALFEDIRRKARVDVTIAEMLKRNYV